MNSGSHRLFSASRRVRVADCDSQGFLRVDSLARYLQDVGYDDTEDIGVGDGGIWVARSISMTSTGAHWPKRNETISLSTYCSGSGRAFAQRHVDIAGSGADISTDTIWVSLNAEGKPTSVPQWFLDAYPDAGKVSSARRLELIDLNKAHDNVESIEWNVRASDFDINGHANNSMAFDALYEVAHSLGVHHPSSVLVEYHQPLNERDNVKVHYEKTDEGFRAWLARETIVSAAMEWKE